MLPEDIRPPAEAQMHRAKQLHNEGDSEQHLHRQHGTHSYGSIAKKKGPPSSRSYNVQNKSSRTDAAQDHCNKQLQLQLLGKACELLLCQGQHVPICKHSIESVKKP
jgi:hypothetical protein